MSKQFTKSDLRTGHEVVLRNGDVCIVMLNHCFNNDDMLCDFNKKETMQLLYYHQKLTCKNGYGKEFDIMEVYETFYGGNRLKQLYKRTEEIDVDIKELVDCYETVNNVNVRVRD